MLSRTCTDVHVCVPVWECACMLSSLAFVCVSRTPPSAVAFVEAGVGFSWLFNKSQFCGQHTKLMRFTARTRGRGGLSRRGEREGSWAKRQRLPIARVEEKFISFILKISHSFPVSPASKRNVSLFLPLSVGMGGVSVGVWVSEVNCYTHRTLLQAPSPNGPEPVSRCAVCPKFCQLLASFPAWVLFPCVANWRHVFDLYAASIRKV